MESNDYYATTRDYVNKAIEHFVGVFKFYIVEMLKRTYPDGIPSNIDGDSRMNNDEPRHKGK